MLGVPRAAFSADPPTAWLMVQPAKVRPGALVSVIIGFENGVLSEMPKLKLPKEFETTTSEPGFSQHTKRSSRNTMLVQVPTLVWQFTCTEPGEYTIPPQEVVVSGTPLTTNSVKVVIKEGQPDELDPLFSLEVGKREFYVGELVPLVVNLFYRQGAVSVPRVGLIEIPKDNFAIARFPQKGVQGSTHMDGRYYDTEVFNSTMSAMKPGKFKVGPASSELVVVIANDPRLLHPMFQGQGETRKIKVHSNDVEVNVVPLPTAGAPKGFNNLVGDFEVTMTAEPQEVALNDPIAIELTITGTGNFDAIAMPTLTDAESWKAYNPRRYNLQSSDNPMDGSARTIGFSQVIVPKKKVAAIPSFEFSYFSPTKKEYVTLRTPPMPITVKMPAEPLEGPPPKAIPVATADGQPIAAPPESEKVPQVKPKITDILAMLPEQPKWLATRPALWSDKSFVTANLVAGGALLLLILGKLGLVAWRAHEASPLAPARHLWRQLHASRLSRSRFYELAAGYISTRGLAGEQVQSVLDRHNLVNYGKDSAEAQEQIPREERNQALSALEPV
ncbi:hypothetical protein AYO49_05525 [Verrucomicrobiaceae bacterium SCGC AG-212-N21]|nr:hypothetical protein AYO49_05525 [Verrucomicrobiaceae bacterium SCGC AG-212-N21]